VGRIVAIVQARMGSTRLPGKVMREAAGEPLIGHLLDRLARCERLDQVVVATPVGDEPLVGYLKERGATVYEGSERDVLERYVGAAKEHEADVVVRITADCPLIDPVLVDQVVDFFLAGSFDYASNTLERGFPRGLDVEVMSRAALERAHAEAREADEREHVTLHIYRHPDRFRLGSFERRLCVDTAEDFVRVERLLQKPGPVFVIAEAGSNWMGSDAFALIDAAAEAGADAVKFQIFRGPTTWAAIPDGFEAAQVDYERIPEWATHCEKRGIEFMASYFSEEDFVAVDPFVKRHKIASPELHHPRLLEAAARSGKPTYLSTGLATRSEIEWALDIFDRAGGRDLTLLQCTVAYPTPPESVNLLTLPSLAEQFGRPVGLSDHTLDSVVAPVGAVALGATVIEKHFTLDRGLTGPDHFYAIEPDELKRMIEAIRLAEQMRGSREKGIAAAEAPLLHFAKRAVHATQKVRRGEPLKEGVNIALLRSGKQRPGIHARHLSQIEGNRATRDLRVGKGIQQGDWREEGDDCS
jgi:sialic acid synthase SpsE/spore coat polysaccharide biosynthesis protein SpsF (cytidylyltransferase family)